MKCNRSRPGFELVSSCPFPRTITVTPRAPPHSPKLLHYWSLTMFDVISRKLVGTRFLTLCKRCFLQPQPTGSLNGGFLPLCRDAVDIFYNLSRLGHSIGDSYPCAEMQLVYSTAPADWATQWGILTSLKRCSRCVLQPQPTGPHSEGDSYHWGEMQLVYSVALADWADEFLSNI